MALVLCKVRCRRPAGVSAFHARFTARSKAKPLCLPRRMDWALKFRLSRDGADLETLLSKVSDAERTIILLKDSGGAVFGGVAGEAWRHSAHFYGNTQSLVFHSMSEPSTAESDQDASTGSGRRVFTCKHGSASIRVFRWSGGNRYFQSVNTRGSFTSVGMGAGGSFAWALDAELLRGTSGPCATFNSPQLSSSAQFKCVELEVWQLVESGMLGDCSVHEAAQESGPAEAATAGSAQGQQ